VKPVVDVPSPCAKVGFTGSAAASEHRSERSEQIKHCARCASACSTVARASEGAAEE